MFLDFNIIEWKKEKNDIWIQTAFYNRFLMQSWITPFHIVISYLLNVQIPTSSSFLLDVVLISLFSFLSCLSGAWNLCTIFDDEKTSLEIMTTTCIMKYQQVQ